MTITLSGQNNIAVKGKAQKKMTFDSHLSKSKAIESFSKKNQLDSNISFVSKGLKTEQDGFTHERHQQFYKGIKVEFGTLISHSENDKVESINAEVYRVENFDINPKLDPKYCLQLALKQVNAVKYLWEDASQSKIVKYQKPTGDLILFPIVKTGEITLAYKFDVYAIEPVSRQEIYVDANTGKILYSNPIIKHINQFNSQNELGNNFKKAESLLTGNASTKYSGLRTIETDFNPTDKFVLNDFTRGNGIITYNCERLPNGAYQDVNFKDNDNNWTSAEHANSFQDDAALDAHWGAEMTYDFWKNVFGRKSFDDQDGLVFSYVHYRKTSTDYANAFWNGSFMTYGDGNGSSIKAFTSIDICGHEIGHAICTYTANLAYQNQSGALNEGFSDIWGACIEQYGRTGSVSGTIDENVWLIGEDIRTGGLRSMSNPILNNDPDTYLGINWKETGDEGTCIPKGGTSGNDYCGVHSNSGVLNHWFYILTAGKSGTNNAPLPSVYNVAGIGMLKSSKIAYLTERDYLTPNATFEDMREASITVAKNLYCANSPETIAVTNAWAAVNVGGQYISIANDIALNAIPNNQSLSCTSTSFNPILTFKNDGINPITAVAITYSIDNGALQSFNWSGNLAPCDIGSFQLFINTQNLNSEVHSLTITTTIANDGNILNNSKSIPLYNNKFGSNNTVNTFESNLNSFISYNKPPSTTTTTTTTVWERGLSNKKTLTNIVAGNSNVYATNLIGTYPANTESYLITSCYDLSNISNPILKFDMAFDLEIDFDVIYMQYSVDNGLTWSILGSNLDRNWYNSDNSSCANCVGAQWTGEAEKTDPNGGNFGTKKQYRQNLSQFGSASLTPQTNIIFRYVFRSDEFLNEDGAIIDNFVIEGRTLSNKENTFNKIAVYPNPVENLINVSLISESNDVIIISLFDSLGRLIKRKEFETSVSDSNKNLDVSTIPPGVYFLKIEQGSLIYNSKIIKK